MPTPPSTAAPRGALCGLGVLGARARRGGGEQGGERCLSRGSAATHALAVRPGRPTACKCHVVHGLWERGCKEHVIMCGCSERWAAHTDLVLQDCMSARLVSIV